ncbi:hypothetical protein GCM10020295_00500 [Streptomyces cinereospinus]
MSTPRPESTTTPLTFGEALERAAARGTHSAVRDGTRWRTWRECRIEAARTARSLTRSGLRAGDVLATQLPNSWELVVLHAATAETGILLLPLHTNYGVHEMRSLLDQSKAVAVVARGAHRGHDRVDDLVALRERCPSLRQVWVSCDRPSDSHAARLEKLGLLESDELSRPAGSWDPAAVREDDAPSGARDADGPGGAPVDRPRDPYAPMMLLASSGTTSRRPKLCVHSHAGLLGNAAAVAADGGLGASDTIVSASPLSHAFGLLSVHLALVTGGRVGLFEGWDARRFLEVLRTASATAAFAVPAQLRDVMAVLRRRGRSPAPSPACGRCAPAAPTSLVSWPTRCGTRLVRASSCSGGDDGDRGGHLHPSRGPARGDLHDRAPDVRG